MLVAGVAVVLLAGGFFFKYAYDMGWIDPARRCFCGALFGLAALGLGEWAFRRKMTWLAAGLFGVGVVFWYYVAWAASPQKYHLISIQLSFAAMCFTSAAGLAISLRSNFVLSALVAAVGALVTPVLLASGQDAQVILLSYLLVVNAAFLAVGLWKNWQSLAPVLMVGTIALFAGWFLAHYRAAPTPALTTLFAWGLLALHGVSTVWGLILAKVRESRVFMACPVMAAAAITVLAAGICRHPAFVHLYCLQILALAGLLLALVIWRNAPMAALLVIAQAGLILGAWLSHWFVGDLAAPACAYSWALLGLALLGIFATARRDWREVNQLLLLLAPALLVAVLLALAAHGHLAGAPLQGQLLLLNAVILALAWPMRAPWMPLLALAWSAAAFLLDTSPLPAPLTWMWAQFALFLLDVLRQGPAAPRQWRIPQFVLASALLAAALLAWASDGSLAGHALQSQLLALNAVVLLLAGRLRTPWMALPALAWSAAALAIDQAPMALRLGWMWGQLGLFLLDLLRQDTSRTWRIVQLTIAASLAAAGLLAWGASGGLDGHSLQVQFLLLNAVVLSLSVPLQTPWLPLLALGWSAGGLGVDQAPLHVWFTWLWIHLSLFLLNVARQCLRTSNAPRLSTIPSGVEGRSAGIPSLPFTPPWQIAHAAAAASLAALALILQSAFLYSHHTLTHLLVLDAAVLAFCLWRRWHALRFGALLWSAAITSALLAEPRHPTLALWFWGLFALFSADIHLRTWPRRPAGREDHNAAISALIMAGMFGATYHLLHQAAAAFLGAYTAAWALAAFAAAWLVWRFRAARILAYVYLAQGLLLLILAVPIQFDGLWVPFFWALEALAAVAAARAIRNPMVLAASPVMLALALAHFAHGCLSPGEARGYPPPVVMVDTIAGAPLAEFFQISTVLWTTIWLSAVAAALAAVVRAGKPILDDLAERSGAVVAVVVSLLLLFIMSCRELPVVTATWWWLVPAAALVVLSSWRGSAWLCWTALLALLAASGKFMIYDTLAVRLASDTGPDISVWPVLNWQFASSAFTAALILFTLRFSRSAPATPTPPHCGAGDLPAPSPSPIHSAVRIFSGLISALLVLWGGSFEIDRYFALAAGSFTDPALAAQMGYSIWWAVHAAATLLIGFAYRSPAARYFAIVGFAVTLAKVLLFDMRNVETIYRILSFLVLGVLLLSASWLYARQMISARKAQEEGKEP